MSEYTELYKMYIATAERVSARRDEVNKMFIILNTTLVGMRATSFLGSGVRLCFMAIALNIIWYFLIKSYKQLNSAKFKVIQELEGMLPYSCFAREEILYKKDGRYDYTAIEKWVPLVFFIFQMLSLIM